MESPAPVALQLSECEHTTGAYRAAVPEGWWVNPEFDDAELGSVSACRFFGPDDFEIMSADRYTPFPQGTAIWMEFLDEGCVGYVNPILDSRETTVDGYPARISRLAQGKLETNPEHTYEYVVTVTADAQCEGDGEYILAFTRRDLAGDYEENKAILDRMMESLQISEP
ncbi:MAG: hypothetical protein ACXWWO_02730 [Candidatus Limnocylindria bacterium]